MKPYLAVPKAELAAFASKPLKVEIVSDGERKKLVVEEGSDFYRQLINSVVYGAGMINWLKDKTIYHPDEIAELEKELGK